jgi:F0F1-type ATP synthase membrane subunit a
MTHFSWKVVEEEGKIALAVSMFILLFYYNFKSNRKHGFLGFCWKNNGKAW